MAATPTLTLTPVPVLTDGRAEEGRLVFVEGCLVAVLVQVSAEEAEPQEGGGWFLEAGFGPCGPLLAMPPPLFSTLEQAQDWVRDRVAG